MSHTLRTTALLLAALAGLAASARGQSRDTMLTITNQDGVVRRFTIADLRALPQVDVRIADGDGNPMVERGPSLRALLTLAGAPSGQTLRGPSMLLVVVATAADSYKVAYTLSELDEQFGARDGIVALTENGHGLAQTDGPLRIILPSESHRARWIRMLVAIKLVKVG